MSEKDRDISRGGDQKMVPAQLIQALVGVALQTDQGAAMMAGFRIAHGLYDGRYAIEVLQAGRLARQSDTAAG